jgi:hypothetical protein
MNNEIEEKIKSFSRQELLEYYRAIVFIDRCVNTIAIGIILSVLFFTNTITVLIGTVAIFFLGNFACAIATTNQYIRARLGR